MNNDWIEWKGGDCPVERGTLVDVRYRDGVEVFGVSALTCSGDKDHVRGLPFGGGPGLAFYWGRSGVDGGIIAYRLHNKEQEQNPEHTKQKRYQDNDGADWIDECARTFTAEEFRGAMKFTIGKYIRRLGKKDDIVKEVSKIEDYSQRWAEYERNLNNE